MILVSGDALFDMFAGEAQGPGALAFDARAGGSPLNVAMGINRLGGAASFFTAFSTDLLGTRLRALLEAEGVDLRYAVETERLTTVSLVGLDTQGVPAYAFHSNGSADTGVTLADVPVLGPEVQALHFGSYSIAVPPVADALATLAADNAERFISLDPNIRPTVEPDMEVWKARIQAFFPAVDLVKISAEDLEILHPGVSAEAYASGAIGAGARMVVVTDGGDTVRAWTATGLEAAATPPTIDVVDTVGAGDTFQACLLSRLAEKGDMSAAIDALGVADLADLLHICAAAAALTSTRRGADLPRRADLEAYLET